MKTFTRLAAFFAVAAVLSPAGLFAAASAPASQPFYTGWLPFWQKNAGTAEVMSHLSDLKEISPFSFEVDPTIGVIDKIGADSEPWTGMIAAAQAAGVKVVPTVASLNGNFIYGLLRSPARRWANIQDILGTILIHNYDGIDIDYEGKPVQAKPYFSAFIISLSKVLHANHKILSCTVESRTPLASRANLTRTPAEYANNFAVLNKYCDEVRIMAYDQANVDKKLDKQKGTGQAYLPVADPAWVEKVIKVALQYISRKKLVLGIPTYGYEYLWTPGTIPTWNDVLRSVTYTQAMAIASSTGMTPLRNSAGELSFLYVPGLTANSGTASSPLNLNQARIVWFTDAAAVAQKLALVKKYKLKGAAFFKFDGQSDPAIWNLLGVSTSTAG